MDNNCYQADYGSDQRQQPIVTLRNLTTYIINDWGPQSRVDDPALHFHQQQVPAMELVPDVPATYAGEPRNACGATLLHHQQSSNSSTGFQQSPTDCNLQGYNSTIAGISIMTQGPAEVMEEEQYGSTVLDKAYNSYLYALKEIFQNIRNGMLVEASSSLLEVSDWLLSQVEELGESSFTARVSKEALTLLNKGLTADDETLYGDRIKLWNEFNTAWLAVLQKQKDFALEHI
jgi:hypothetical protein